MHAPDETPFRYKAIEDHVLHLLQSGTLRPGQRLPSLRRMGADMKVSVPTVAQAYERLEGLGVVEARERSGFFVRRDYGRLAGPGPIPGARPEAMDVSRPGLEKAIREVFRSGDVGHFREPYPHESLLAGRCLARRLRAAMADDPLGAAASTDHAGRADLRAQLALRTMAAGVRATAEDVTVTTGALDAAASLLRCLTRPGDPVLIQSPSYMIYLTMLEHMGRRAIEIPSCPRDGVPVGLVADAIRDFGVKACLFIPNFHLDGTLMPDEAKRELVRVLTRLDVPLIEDDVYGDLHFGSRRPCLCRAFDERGQVAVVSSFSKTLAPGYRVGWALPGRYAEAFERDRQAANAFASGPTQMALAGFLARGEYDRHLKRLRAALGDYMGRLHCAVSGHFPEGTQAAMPQGGTCMWIRLPEGTDSRALFFRARDRGIAVIPGALLSFSGTFDNYIRLNCSGLWSDDTDRAIRILGDLVCEQAAGA